LQSVNLAEANPAPVYSLEMLEEYLNYMRAAQIHYEHPIVLVNRNYTFLYDLNISPYLLPWSNKSTAHFEIRWFETGYEDLQINTVAVDGTLNLVNYVVTNQ
jgi:hypothetical protein